jgi:hypothetical protein
MRLRKLLSYLKEIILKQLVFEVIQFVCMHTAIEYDLTGDHELPELVAQRHEVVLDSALATRDRHAKAVANVNWRR